MRTLIWLIGIFALAVGLALFTGVNDGYALLVWPPYRIQVALNFLVPAMLLLFLVAFFLFRLIGRALELPGRVGEFRQRRRRSRAERSLRDALCAHYEGRYSQAIQLAEKSYAHGEDKGLAALIAARAAHALRDDTRYRLWLTRALEHDERIRTARLMTEAELAVEGQRFDEAQERLATLSELGYRHIAALRLGVVSAEARGQWDDVVRLARQLHKHKALSDEAVAPLLQRAHLARLAQLTSDAAAQANYWKEIQANVQRQPAFLLAALPLLAQAGQGALARKGVEQVLEREWNSDLAQSYLRVCTADAASGVARGEKWLQDHPRDAGLLQTLGQLCISERLWGKAQGYLEASSNLAPDLQTDLALAHLFEETERAEEAQTHYRAAARRVST